MRFSTGNAAYWTPPGFTIHIDTSWDKRGTHVACRTSDVISRGRGSPESLGSITIRDGAPVLTGSQVWALAPSEERGGLGIIGGRKLLREEAERIFAELTGTVTAAS